MELNSRRREECRFETVSLGEMIKKRERYSFQNRSLDILSRNANKCKEHI